MYSMIALSLPSSTVTSKTQISERFACGNEWQRTYQESQRPLNEQLGVVQRLTVLSISF